MTNTLTAPHMEKKTAANPGRALAAYLGAAIGDALGWPFEGRARTKLSTQDWNGDFFPWEKRGGSRFAPLWEHVQAGEYSDDTQLILAVTRARTTGDNWWEYLAAVELPFWTCYERGGGGATKRAANSWLAGTAPWDSSAKDVARQYFAAGGNGAAMRVLPHCVSHANGDDFAALAVDVLSDAVTTHGHPRALVGAIAFAYVVWTTLRRKGILDYGGLLYQCIGDVSTWSKLPSIAERWPSWQASTERHYPEFLALWESTTNEMVSLLQRALDGLTAGALSEDLVVLRDLGGLTPKTNGAGTTTAAGAIYLASRYAAAPSEGVRRAASAEGADTDTLASMTASLLGAINGTEWLEEPSRWIQDREYIQRAAESIVFKLRQDAKVRRVGKRDINEFLTSVSAETSEARPLLPIGGQVIAVTPPTAAKADEKRFVSNWKLQTDVGLTLFVRPSTALMRTKSAQQKQPALVADDFEPTVGISLRVRNLSESRRFYEYNFGLRASGVSKKSVRFSSTLALREEEGPASPSCDGLRLFINVADVDACFRRMTEAGANIDSILERGKNRSFECRDPDGYVIEVFERVLAGRQP